MIFYNRSLHLLLTSSRTRVPRLSRTDGRAYFLAALTIPVLVVSSNEYLLKGKIWKEIPSLAETASFTIHYSGRARRGHRRPIVGNRR
jgi:hypothetical protein